MPTNSSVKRIMNILEDDPSKVLGVTVNGKAITTKQFIPRSEAQSAPEISFAVPDPSATYMVVALDIDAPFPSFTVLGPILHWIQPGFKVGPNSSLTSSEPFVANYIGPAPPPGSAPHRYCFFLFEQPKDFDGSKHAPAGGKPLSNWYRMRYDLDVWQKTAKLGEPLAANYFLSN
ncbi:Phosphatidylethanolamine-binding protein PEBP [Moelleriella libera RCEF 2490]|uniref:Phosphatidylethanolamine-binding protein PEBP n=1 Tax=Moelleriella libera RCEF 2490 TaxID=1081109 RepID=A0A167WY15_9HYPO|nr:Phosphatidylethanolamine-binding protein PEBP [Moelleriella libera RCEF 2490]